LDEYVKNEEDRIKPNLTFQVVYDYIEHSPFYNDEAKYGPYIDEKDGIELPNPTD
jgi:hypothetical protein